MDHVCAGSSHLTVIPVANPLAQYESLREDIDGAIARVLERGHYVLGPEVAAFEEAFSSYVGVSYGIGTNSGTDAITIALRALGVGPDDRVATVSHTAIATVAAIVATGATPLLVDIDPSTYTMDPNALAVALDERVKAVLPVHLYGGAAAIGSICEVAAQRNIPVVEDCAQAAGLSIGNRRAGSFGYAACFSFYPTKNLGALGDGGMIVTDDEAIAATARRMRQYGWDDERRSDRPGMNSRLDELQAAVLNVKFPHLDRWNARRVEVAARYSEALTEAPLRLPVAPQAHVYHLYVVAADYRDELQASLRGVGVQSAIHYPMPVHLEAGYIDLVEVPTSGLPNTERAVGQILSLPLYPELAETQIDAVSDAVREGCEQHRRDEA